MAAKLQCEICGGKLIGRPGGIFECDSCGVEYDTAWAKQKIQEIRGTVSVEGTVEVQGTVKVEENAKKEALLRRGFLALEGGRWEEAKEFFDNVLNYDAEYAEAYLGIAMSEYQCRKQDELFDLYTRATKPLSENQSVAYAREFGDEELKNRFKELDIERENLLAEEHKKAAEDLESFLRLYNERIPARKSLYFEGRTNSIIGLGSNGRLYVLPGDGPETWMECIRGIREWKDIVSISISAGVHGHSLGLRSDGTVLAAGDNKYGQCDVSSWSRIKEVYAGDYYSIGLRADGTVVAAGNNGHDCCNVEDWTQITQIITAGSPGIMYNDSRVTIGLKDDGTLVATDREIYNRIKGWRDIDSLAWWDDGNVLGKRIRDGEITIFQITGSFSNSYVQNSTEIKHKVIKDIISSGGPFGIRTNRTLVKLTVPSDLQYTLRSTKQYYKTNDDSCLEWKDVIDISYAAGGICGLHSDGTVSFSRCWKGSNSGDVTDEFEAAKGWTNIIALYGYSGYLYGLRSDGTIVTTDIDRRDELSKWKLFSDYSNIERERIMAKEQVIAKQKAEKEWADAEIRAAARIAEAKRQERVKALREEQTALRKELADLKGMFSGRRRREIEARLLAIEKEI